MVFIGTALVLAISLVIGIVARRRSDNSSGDFLLGGANLRAMHIGLSAGATGNSGFIVTAGVALGYIGGLTYCFLPLFWLLGEVLFWKVFAQRLRVETRKGDDKSIVGLLTQTATSRSLLIGVALIAIAGLTLYAASQVVVAQQLLSGGMGLNSDLWPLMLLAVMAGYVVLGGFRSTVWTDVFQAFVMIALTVSCLVFFTIIAFSSRGSSFSLSEIAPFRGWPMLAILAFAATWTLAGAGFGLSQPHVAERYIAARDDAELRKAMWIYNGFLQFTWLGMTVVGVLLRSVHPGAGYDESILLTSLGSDTAAVVVGGVIGAMLCAVVSTVDSILHSAGAMLAKSLLGKGSVRVAYLRLGAIVVAVLVGVLFLRREDTVFGLSSLAVAFLTVALAPAVLMRLYSRSGSGANILVVAAGVVSYIAWYLIGVGDIYGKLFPRFEIVPAFASTMAVVGIVIWVNKGKMPPAGETNSESSPSA